MVASSDLSQRARDPWLTAANALALAVTLLLVGLHLTFFLHAGGLWRDEVQIFNLANLPTCAQWWDYNQHDTFPVVWQLVLRGWTAAGGGSDVGLRLLGLLVGLGIVAGLWLSARRLAPGRSPPLLSLVLAGASPLVIRFGDSLRGYGLGALAMLCLIPAVVRVTEQPTRRALIVAALAALLAVHTMHFNAVVLLALAGGAAAVSLRRRRLWPAAPVIAIGVLAAVSILPYLDPILRQRRWKDIMTFPVTPGWLFQRFIAAVTDAGGFMLWVWLGLIALGPGLCLYRAARPEATDEHKDRALLVGVTLVLGIAVYTVFLIATQVLVNPWYYLTLLLFLAVMIDASAALAAVGSARLYAARVGLSAIVVLAVLPRVVPAMQVRMTNIDGVAAALQGAAGPADLIVVNPWWYGVSFARYYHGAAPFSTVPVLSELRVQRFDLLRQIMAQPDPMQPLLQQVERTLQSGHRVWIVGELAPLPPGARPRELAPFPQGASSQWPYMSLWQQQLAYLLQSHAGQVDRVPLVWRPTSEFENVGLLRAQGYR